MSKHTDTGKGKGVPATSNRQEDKSTALALTGQRLVDSLMKIPMRVSAT